MKKAFISPSRYIQGEGELKNLATYIAEFGNSALLIASNADRARVQQLLDEAMKESDCKLSYGDFGEECTKTEIQKQADLAKQSGVSVIIGLGGGKALDTAKAASYYSKLPVIVVPTIASTDAPTSSLAIIYKANGEFEQYFFMKRNPDLVLIDTAIIAKAPVRFLVAGMGDALATYFEARSCERSYANNIPGGKSTLTALAIAKTCYNTLMEDSLKAIAACNSNVVTQALENIIEANVLMSGLGFESSGLAACHSVHDGLTALEETHHFYHGEKVAFGVIVHLVLENAPSDEINLIIKYLKAVGLPTCLKELGITEVTEEKLMKVAKAACAEGETIYNMPFEIKPEDVYAAILAADKLGAQA